MRKVTKEVVGAFIAGRERKVGNTWTDGKHLWLHRNMIAEKVEGGIRISTCGWNTPTTKDRLNGIPGVSVYTHRGELYLNGKSWSGSPATLPLP